MNALVSVILPIYRVADVLPTCLDALARQTYRQLELIFVDDCSPDDSYQIVHEAAPRLQTLGMRVMVIRHEVNQGVAAARSTALEHATGEWIFHYDADDRLADNAIEAMLHLAETSQADIVGCDWVLCHGNSQRRMHQPQVETGLDAFRAMCQGIMKWNLWLFIVRRALIEQEPKLRFLPGQNMGEDMMFMGKTFLRASRIAMLPEPLYYYTKNDNGQLTGSYTDAHWTQVGNNIAELERYVHEHASHRELSLIQQLKLTLKLPLLISPRQADYDRWYSWMPEANASIMDNSRLPLRTRLLQRAAASRQWWLVRLYYEIVMKRLYAMLYK